MADLTSDINLDVASPPPKKLRTSSVSSAGDIDKFVNLFSEGCPAQGDYFRSVLVFSEDKYVVTQSYRELRKKVNSALKSMERKTITLRGPEGVGKGMTLAAVASEYSKEKPCVLWSPTHGTQSTFCAALKEVYRQFGKEMEFSDNVQDIDLVRGLANIFPNRCIVLIELGSVTELDAKVQQSLVDIMSIGSVKLFVISLSSGAGGRGFPCNTLHTFKKQMMKIKAASHVNFVSFTEAEADVLLSDTDKYPLEQEFYYGLTNYNPGLLSLCAGCGGESEAEQNVQQQVRFFVDAIKKSLEVDKYFWLKSSLETSMRMLSYAYNCEMIPQERLRELI